MATLLGNNIVTHEEFTAHVDSHTSDHISLEQDIHAVDEKMDVKLDVINRKISNLKIALVSSYILMIALVALQLYFKF